MLRQQRLLILLVTMAFGAAAYGISARQTPVYQAEAALSFSDPNQDLDLFGTPVVPRQAAPDRATREAERATTLDTARGVKRRLSTPRSVQDLASRVSARVEVRTNFVVVSVEDSDADFTAQLANAYVREVAGRSIRTERLRLRRLISDLRRRLKGLDAEDPGELLSAANTQERISRLQGLLSVARPVEITRVASVPIDPVSPRPVRNTIFGLLLGLTLGILAAFARDSLDRRLRGARQIQEQLGLPLLGHVSHDAMGRAGMIPNGRSVMSAPDLEAFRILRTNLEFLDVDTPTKSIVITSALPEEGKSTVAASLACAHAAAGVRTLLVECDLRRPALAERLGIERAPGLTDYLIGRASPQDVLQVVTLPGAGGNGTAASNGGAKKGAGKKQQDEEGTEDEAPTADGAEDEAPTPTWGQTEDAFSASGQLVCITAGAPAPRPAEMLGSERFRTFLEQVSLAYDMVVLDSSPLLSVVDTLELIPHVDGVVICVRAARTTRDQARAAKSAVDHLPSRPTGLVVTDVRHGSDEDYGFYSYAYAYGVGSKG